MRLLLLLFGLLLRARPGAGRAASCPQQQPPQPPQPPPRRLGGRPPERAAVQREILALLGLPAAAWPPPSARPSPPAAAAPLFMLDLYRAVAGHDEDDEPGRRALDGADTVMSFVNVVELDRDIFYPKPYWKEFRFDLTQIPSGESVTAAEFRIYKMQSITRHVNQTLRVTVYEIVQEHPNRESELRLLDLQDFLTGTEGWLAFDVAAASNHWLLNRRYNLGLRLYVETDEGQSVDPGLAGLLGRHGPRSRQPFMVTFFRASQSQARVPRSIKQLRKKQYKKPNSFPHVNRLPGSYELGDCPTRVLGLLLPRRLRLPSGFLHECHQPRHPPVPGPPDEAGHRPQGLLCPDQTQRHLRSLLRQQQQRHPQETPQHGG